MAFIILSDREGEIERRELAASALTIGRAGDCQIPVRDGMLSRRHCRIEPRDGHWVLVDLGSKNGTHIGESSVTSHILDHGDIIRIGRTRLLFQTGVFVPPTEPPRRRPSNRPIDPYDAMSSTVAGLDLEATDHADMKKLSQLSGFPMPMPKPPEPRGYVEDGVGMLVAKIASGVWDSRAMEKQAAGKTSSGSSALLRTGQSLWIKPTPMRHLKRMLHAPAHALRKPIMREVPHPVAHPAGHPVSKRRFADEVPAEHRPNRWLVVMYLGAAWAMFAASMCAIAWGVLSVNGPVR